MKDECVILESTVDRAVAHVVERGVSRTVRYAVGDAVCDDVWGAMRVDYIEDVVWGALDEG